MKTPSQPKKRKRISRKRFEAKIMAEAEYKDKTTNFPDDSSRNIPEIIDEQGISNSEKFPEDEGLNKENF